MKRLTTAILMVMLLFFLAACGGGSNTIDAAADTAAKEAAAAEAAAEAEEAARIAELKPMQDFANQLFALNANIFVKPLSIEVLDAWGYYNETYHEYRFTFKFNVANNAGVTQTVYFGNDLLGFPDLTSRSLNKARDSLLIGSDFYFEQDVVDAMQNGERLDANAIQEYFLANY